MAEHVCDSVHVDHTSIPGGRHDATACKAARRARDFRRPAPKKGGADLLAAMRARRTVCLRRLGRGHAGEVRFSRFLNSHRVSPEEMLATAAEHCASRVAGRHVLAIQDTSEINYRAHAGRSRGLGLAGNGIDPGFFSTSDIHVHVPALRLENYRSRFARMRKTPAVGKNR